MSVGLDPDIRLLINQLVFATSLLSSSKNTTFYSLHTLH